MASYGARIDQLACGLPHRTRRRQVYKLYLPASRLNIFYVYVIAREGSTYYIGHTDDLRQRWNEHLSGIGADWTKKHKPIHIAHYEEYGNREGAIARERELKTGFGRKWLKREIKAGRARQAGDLTPEEIKIIEDGTKIN